MKYCEHCKANINTNKKYCPLCYNEIDGEDKAVLVYKTKDMQEKTKKNKYLAQKILLYISLCAVIVCLTVNLLTQTSVLWSLIVAASILYVWILVRHTIISRRNIFEKLSFQILGILAIIFLSYKISGGGNWFWNYVTPSVCILTVVTIFILWLSCKSEHLCSFFLLSLIMLVASTVFIFTKLDTFAILNIVSMVMDALVILGILIFNFKGLKRSFMKNFNI